MELQEGGERKAAADVVDSCSSFLHSRDSSCGDKRRRSNSGRIRTFFHEFGRVCSSDVDFSTARSHILLFTFSNHKIVLRAIQLEHRLRHKGLTNQVDEKIAELAEMTNELLKPGSGFVFCVIYIVVAARFTLKPWNKRISFIHYIRINSSSFSLCVFYVIHPQVEFIRPNFLVRGS